MLSSGQQVLLVEDDVTVARALSRTLARCGHAVTVARSCSAARTLTHTFDVAILDLDLPDGNGVDLARELIHAGKVPSVVFFTSSTDRALLARARRRGAVVMKASGTGLLLSLLFPDAADPPQSGTAPSQKSRRARPSAASVVRKSRAR